VTPARNPATPDTASPSATVVRSSARHAYCPLCGRARTEIAAGALKTTEEALCPDKCLIAWQALAALRLRESTSDRVTTRRQYEYESGEQHAAALSELLLRRWREGDWSIRPDELLTQLGLA
jgi:hypothetical protein